MPSFKSYKTVRQILLPSLILICIAQPVLALPESQKDVLLDECSNITQKNQSSTMFTSIFKNASQNITLQINGSLTTNENESEIKTLNGKISIIDRRNKPGFRIEIIGSEKQQMKQTYWINDKENAFDAQGQRWLASMIPMLLRESAVDAEKRVARLHKKGGADAVLAEIELINSGFARSRYITLLSELGQLDPSRLARLLTETGKIDSGFEMQGSFLSIIKQQELNPELQVLLLTITSKKISSDFERRCVLESLTPKMAQAPNVTNAWQKAVEGMGSDAEIRTVIDTFANRSSLTPEEIDAALNVTHRIDSTFQRRSALETLAKHLKKANSALVSNYLKSAKKINSDFDRRSALITLLGKATLNTNDYLQFLDSLRGIKSDFEVCTILQAVAKQIPADDELISRYRKIARGLGSHERAQAEQAISHIK